MAWGKFHAFRATGSPKQNIPGRTTLYSPGAIFGPVSPETAPEPPSTQRLQTLFAHIKLLLAFFLLYIEIRKE